LQTATKLRILLEKVYEKSKRLFEIPPFKQYAICDGIYNLLFGRKFSNICDGIYNLLFGRKFSKQEKEPIPQTPQLLLPLDIFSSYKFWGKSCQHSS